MVPKPPSMAKQAMGAVSTFSLKEAQRCFDKERQALLCDLETLRQQLVKKDQHADRAAAIASAHAIQLKREIASLQAASAGVEAERIKVHDQYTHTSSLLETALDQRQDDQVKLSQMKGTLRTIEKQHEETLKLVKKEAAANVRATQEERQALRARVEHLRGKLETERKEWQDLHHPVANELQQCKTRLQLVDKELQDSRYRERSNFQLKDKMGNEVMKLKRKVTDLSTALQEALHTKNELRAEHTLVMRNMKDKWREVLQTHYHTKEHLLMMQEDYNGLFCSRTCIQQQNEEMQQTMKQVKARHQQIVKGKEQECWEIEQKWKTISSTCSKCLKTPEQNEQDEKIKLDAVREQTRLEVTRTLELDRWDRYQEVNTKYFDTNKQLLAAIEESELLREKCKLATSEFQELQSKEKKLSSLYDETQARLTKLSAKRDQEVQETEGVKRRLQDLVDNISSLTVVTVNQNKKLQELETARLEERERLSNQVRCLESDKKIITEDHQQLMNRYKEYVAQYEALKQEKRKEWNEIVEAQLSANLLIEAHTIDDLLQVKTKCANGFILTSKACSQRDHVTSNGSIAGSADTHSLIISLRRECATLRKEIAQLRLKLRDESETLQSEDGKEELERESEVQHLRLEIEKLNRKMKEQALTIHELTLEEDEDDDDDDGNDEQKVGSGSIKALHFTQGVSSCTDSCASRVGCSDIDRRSNSSPVYHNESREVWLSS